MKLEIVLLKSWSVIFELCLSNIEPHGLGHTILICAVHESYRNDICLEILNVFAKRIDSRQPARSAQTDVIRNVLRNAKFQDVQEIFYPRIESIVGRNGF